MKNLILLSAFGMAAVASAGVPADIRDVRLKGHVGEQIDACIRHHVIETDVTYLTDCFYDRTERGAWQTEFWGKYMHSAMPFATYTGCPRLRATVDAGLDRILGAQLPEGYIGNYPADAWCDKGWDVWGMKYTLLGLLHYYDGAKGTPRGAKALEAARRLCDFVIRELGPGGKRPFWKTGNYSGMPSLTILEPVVWLYNRTNDRKYLDFATYLVDQMSLIEKGAPRLIDLALKDVPVYRRWPLAEDADPSKPAGNRLKAYEMMSCYQGLLEYYEVTDRKDCLTAAINTAKSIARDEINIAGGAASSEQWFNGAAKQHLPYKHLQETCVTTTWLRLCEKLLAVTGDRFWADELEKAFYNAYLAAMRRDGGAFAAYTPLNGTRLYGHDHCAMHTDCCNANGPRGFLAFLRAFIEGDGNAAVMNFYASGRASVEVPALREKVTFDQYTYYPKMGRVRMWYRTRKTLDFALRLRIPAWSEKTAVRVNGTAVADVRPGSYLELARTWKDGDCVEIDFDLAVRTHKLDHAVAFTRGPVVLARDTRTGDVGEVLRELTETPKFALVRSDEPGVWMTFSSNLPFGCHSENTDGRNPAPVLFTDYASAGNDWTPRNNVRTWFATEWRIPSGW